MSDSVTVIAFAPTGANDRRIAWQHCRRFWDALGLTVVECRADEADYCKAAVAHAGADAAQGNILVFADADCLVDPRALHECIDAISNGHADAASPKTVTQRLTAEESQMVYCGAIPGRGLKIQAYRAQDCGGVFVASREFWKRTGGMDTRFHGWGGEDGSYGAVCRSMGNLHRAEGVMYHLWHEPQPTRKDGAYSTRHENNVLHIAYLDAERAGTMAEFLDARPQEQKYEVDCD